MKAPLLTLGVQTALSTAFIVYFCLSFKINQVLLLVHIPLVFGVFAVSLLAMGLFLYIQRIRQSEIARHLLGLIPGLTFAAIGILYAADFASYFWTGSNINYTLVRLFVNDWRHGGELISLSRSIYVAVIVFVTLVVAIHITFGGALSRGLERLLLPRRPANPTEERRRVVKSGVVITALLMACVVDAVVLFRHAPYSELLSSDPFLSLVRSTTEVYDPRYPAFSEHIRQQDQRCRSSYPRTQNFEKKNVVVIVVDALRSDHTQVYGYQRATTPFLSDLTNTGRLRKVEFATSTCSGTFCGVMSTLSSKGVKRLVPETFKLSDLLHDQGYKTYFILSGSHNIQGLREAYGREMDLYFDGENSKEYSSEDDRVLFEGLDLVPSHSVTPAFFYLHLMAVHLIGVKQESFNHYQPVAERSDFRAMFRGEPGHWPAIINTYDNSVMQADDTIKQIFEVLERKGYLQNSLVVILADHGEGLGERTKYGWGHGHWLYREFIQIPMLIYDDSPATYANLKFATQIDVAPTIADRLGLRVPDCWEGTSLLKRDAKQITNHQTGLSKPCYAVLYRTDAAMYQYIYCSVGKTEELYDLKNDPNEQRNLIDTVDAALLTRMRAELQANQAD